MERYVPAHKAGGAAATAMSAAREVLVMATSRAEEAVVAYMEDGDEVSAGRWMEHVKRLQKASLVLEGVRTV